MIAEVNLAEKPVPEPIPWEEVELGSREASEYRAAAARFNYLALDRPDILFASKECSRRMYHDISQVVFWSGEEGEGDIFTPSRLYFDTTCSLGTDINLGIDIEGETLGTEDVEKAEGISRPASQLDDSKAGHGRGRGETGMHPTCVLPA